MSNNNNEIHKHLATAAYKKIIQAPVESFERASKEETTSHGWTDLKLSLGNGVVIMISDSLNYICVTVREYIKEKEEEKVHKDCVHALKVINESML